MNEEKQTFEAQTMKPIPRNCRGSQACQRIATVEVMEGYGKRGQWYCETHAKKAIKANIKK